MACNYLLFIIFQVTISFLRQVNFRNQCLLLFDLGLKIISV